MAGALPPHQNAMEVDEVAQDDSTLAIAQYPPVADVAPIHPPSKIMLGEGFVVHAFVLEFPNGTRNGTIYNNSYSRPSLHDRDAVALRCTDGDASTPLQMELNPD